MNLPYLSSLGYTKSVNLVGFLINFCKDYLKIVEYIKSTKPTCHVYTITNVSYKTKESWTNFASISNEYDTINFSVDGYDQASNDLYRVNSNFESIMLGMKQINEIYMSYRNFTLCKFKICK